MADIPIETAEITTATVTIRTVVITNRKLTLATYRQVPGRTPGPPHPVPWGWVNYHDRCPPPIPMPVTWIPETPAHIHWLGEQEGRLVRWTTTAAQAVDQLQAIVAARLRSGHNPDGVRRWLRDNVDEPLDLLRDEYEQIYIAT